MRYLIFLFFFNMMIYFSTVCYPQKILNHHLFFPRGTFISCFPFLADAGKNAWMQTLLYSAFIVEKHIITVSVFSLPWDLHSWGGLGSFCRMLKELNKCFGVDVHLSWARKHYPPKQRESSSYFSFTVGKESNFSSVFSSPMAFWSHLPPEPCRSWWPEPLTLQVRHPGLAVARKQRAPWPTYEPMFAFTAWRGHADLISSQQGPGLQDRLAPPGRRVSGEDALPGAIAWEPPASKAMGPKLMTMLMDMGWETLCPR